MGIVQVMEEFSISVKMFNVCCPSVGRLTLPAAVK